MTSRWKEIVKKIDDYRWEIPTSYKEGMSVPGRIFASESMLDHIFEEHAFEQVANVAFLPGIVRYSLAMPDIHWGYGFPIGGVAATRVKDGVVSPGGVGFDINCGVRLVRTNLTEEEVRARIEPLVNELFYNIPSGLGSEGKIRASGKELDEVMVMGSRWAVERGYGLPEDIVTTEESGCMKGARADKVSAKAKKRGLPQLGTLGSGNHFLEVAVVDELYDRDAARVMGIEDLVRSGAPPDTHWPPRLRSPDMLRLCGTIGAGGEKVRHQPARPPACLCPGGFAGGQGLPGGDGICG